MCVIAKSLLYHPKTTSISLDNSIRKNPLLKMSSFSKTEIAILDILFGLFSSYKEVYVSQSTLASWTGVTRRHINRVIAKLSSLGVIAKVYRSYNTCLYLIDDFFRKDSIKMKLKDLLPNIVTLCSAICNKLFTPFRKKTIMEEKKLYKKGRRYSASYHKPWREDTQQDALKDIFLAESPNRTLDETLLQRFRKLQNEIPCEKFEQIIKNGRDLKQRVKIAERYLAGLKLLRGEVAI